MKALPVQCLLCTSKTHQLEDDVACRVDLKDQHFSNLCARETSLFVNTEDTQGILKQNINGSKRRAYVKYDREFDSDFLSF